MDQWCQKSPRSDLPQKVRRNMSVTSFPLDGCGSVERGHADQMPFLEQL